MVMKKYKPGEFEKAVLLTVSVRHATLRHIHPKGITPGFFII